MPQRSPFRAFERQSNWERNRGFAEPAWRTRARCARVRRLQQPLGEGRRPFSCFGFFCGGGGRGYSCTPGAFSLPVSAACVGQLLSTIRGSLRDGVGKDGTVALGATSRLNAAVMSPVCSRRHWLKFGTSGPNRRSRKRSSEVWSNVFLHTSPPRVNGEITRHGTRKPRPIGPLKPPASAESFTNSSPGVPGGAVGGGT